MCVHVSVCAYLGVITVSVLHVYVYMFACVMANRQHVHSCSFRGVTQGRIGRCKKKLHTVSHRQLWFHLQSADCFLHKRIHIFAAITIGSSDKQWNSRWMPTFSGSDLAGLTLNIFDMSSELRCWATSHSLAVMSILLQMSMSTRLAFSWILVSRSDICCRGEDRCFRWHVQSKHLLTLYTYNMCNTTDNELPSTHITIKSSP